MLARLLGVEQVAEPVGVGLAVEQAADRSWTFLTNHARVLLCIARDRGIPLRDVADRIGITERATQSIVRDLVDGGYVTRERVGNRNRYDSILTLRCATPLSVSTT